MPARAPLEEIFDISASRQVDARQGRILARSPSSNWQAWNLVAASQPPAISFVSHTVGPTPTITIHVPGPLRMYCAGAAQLSISAHTVRAALEGLERSQSALYRNVCDETGTVRRHLNVFVNSDNVRDLDGIDTTLTPGDVVTILPAVSGG